MAVNNNDASSIRQYLLGQLSADEQEKIEARLLVDDDLFQEFEVSKVELVEDYCAGELTTKERDWLEQHFLASSEGKQQHTLALALSHRKQPQPTPRPSFVDWLRSLFTSHPWGFAATASAALILTITAFLFFPPARSTTSVAVSLTNSTITRSTGAPTQRISLGRDAGEVRASLMLPEPAPQGTKYRAQLDDRTKRQTVKIVEQSPQLVVVSIPAAQLPSGSYSLKLYVTNPDGSEEPIPGDYLFDVERTN